MPYDFRTIRYIPGLNGIRFAAVSLVMVAHFGLGHRVPGGFGVTIFFFLSGFLITTLMLQERTESGTVRTLDFYMRRLLRIGPELFVLVALSSAVGIALGTPPKVADIAAALTYTTNYYIAFSQQFADLREVGPYWSHAWSLAVEEHYYLTFPFLFAAMYQHRYRTVVFFLGVLIGCPLWRLAVCELLPQQETWPLPYTYVASDARFDSIAWGALFAFAARTPFRLGPAGSGLALASGGALLIVSLACRDEQFRQTLRYSLQGLGLFLVFCHLYLCRSDSLLVRFAEFPAFQLGGVWSYGAYLWHGEANRLADALLELAPSTLSEATIGQAAIRLALGFLGSFAAAAVSYELVAKPCLRLRHKFGSGAAF